MHSGCVCGICGECVCTMCNSDYGELDDCEEEYWICPNCGEKVYWKQNTAVADDIWIGTFSCGILKRDNEFKSFKRRVIIYSTDFRIVWWYWIVKSGIEKFEENILILIN